MPPSSRAPMPTSFLISMLLCSYTPMLFASMLLCYHAPKLPCPQAPMSPSSHAPKLPCFHAHKLPDQHAPMFLYSYAPSSLALMLPCPHVPCSLLSFLLSYPPPLPSFLFPFLVACTKSVIIFSFTLRFTGYYYSSFSCICLLPRQSCSNGEHARSSVSYFPFLFKQISKQVFVVIIVDNGVVFCCFVFAAVVVDHTWERFHCDHFDSAKHRWLKIVSIHEAKNGSISSCG